MRKNIFNLMIIWMFCILVIPIEAEGNYPIQIGETFTYDIITSHYNITIGKQYFETNYFNINNTAIPSNSQVNVTLVNVTVYNDDFSYINYTISSDAHYEKNIILLHRFYYLALFDVDMNYINAMNNLALDNFDLNNNFSDSGLQNGLPSYLVAYFTNSSFNDFFISYVENLIANYTSVSNESYEGVYYIASYNYTEINGLMYFESYIRFTCHNEHCINYGESNSQFIYVYDISTGLLYGARMFGSFKGKHNGISMKSNVDFQIELEGYNLPDSIFTTEKLSSIRVFFFLLYIPLILIVVKKERKIKL